MKRSLYEVAVETRVQVLAFGVFAETVDDAVDKAITEARDAGYDVQEARVVGVETIEDEAPCVMCEGKPGRRCKLCLGSGFEKVAEVSCYSGAF